MTRRVPGRFQEGIRDDTTLPLDDVLALPDLGRRSCSPRPASPWKRSEIVRDRPRESSLAGDVLDIARMPWRARRARARRPAAAMYTDSMHWRMIAFPVSSCLLLEANASRHQIPLRARADDRSTSSFKDNPSQPRPTYFRDGTIPDRMHDL